MPYKSHNKFLHTNLVKLSPFSLTQKSRHLQQTGEQGVNWNVMDRDEAIKVISSSLNLDTSSPFVGVGNRDAEAKVAGEKLLSSVIEPFAVKVVAALHDKYEFKFFSVGSVFAIAESEDRKLLYNPQLELFALGWGYDPSSFTMLGFATNDALAEWRG